VGVSCSCGVIQNHQCTPYACCLDSDCSGDKICSGNACITPVGCNSDTQCSGGETCTDGYCKKKNIPPAPNGPKPKVPINQTQPACTSGSQCGAGQECSGGACTDVSGVCGYAANHSWVTYACGPEPGCPKCQAGNICIDRGCTPPANITLSGKGLVGENLTLLITYPYGPCANCTLQFLLPSGAKVNGTTDANGRFTFLLNEKGTYGVMLERESRSISITVAAAPSPGFLPQLATLVSNVVTNTQSWLMALLVAAVFLVIYLRYRGKR
jgi:hypothetical protein